MPGTAARTDCSNAGLDAADGAHAGEPVAVGHAQVGDADVEPAAGVALVLLHVVR